MPFTAQFTVAQSAAGVITLTDTSDYTDEDQGGFNNRVVNLWRSDGTLLSGSAYPFPFGADTLQILPERDYAVMVELILTSDNPIGGSSYTDSIYTVFKAYGQLFRYALIQGEAANPNIINKPNYIANKQAVFSSVVSADIAISYSDISNAQLALDRVNYFIKNKSLLF